MRSKMAVVTVLLVLLGVTSVFAGETETDLVDKFFQRAKEKHTRHLAWMAGSFGLNRINRQNDYNAWATYESDKFSNGSLSWLGEAKSFGLDFGMVFAERFCWSLGGEYWLKMGQNNSGAFAYDEDNNGTYDINVPNLKSEIKVWGITTGVQYYLVNPPTVTEQLTRPAVRFGGSVGYYQVNWDLWEDYQNLNLSTSVDEPNNITYKGSGPGFTINLGGEYPLSWSGLVIGADVGYMILNFKNVAWYNSQDQEVVATYDGTPGGRVDLDFSGVKGRVEVKRFFSW